MSTSPKANEDYENTYMKYREMMETLPKGEGWRLEHVFNYQGFWLESPALKGVVLLQNHFKPQPTDIILAAFMKSGTTWLRTLMFSTINRSHYNFSTHPLLQTGPHGCFPFLDHHIFKDYPITNLDLLPTPRLFATHFAHSLFPESVTASSSSCKFVYICRDPKDVLISKWYFMNKLRAKGLKPHSLHDAFELFCEGISEYGPFWDHVLGYWNASLESPNKILFLKYEDLKREPSVQLKRLAEFMGKPFSLEEEKNGVVEEIAKLCSFENLSNLEVNKSGVHTFNNELKIENREFFRKGETGDWQNHLTHEMRERLDRITEDKLNGTGLTLGSSPN